MCSTYGEYLKLSIFGQSHGAAIGACLDGIPAGLPVDMDALAAFLGRRAPGRNAYSTPRKEADAPEILAGIVDGFTCGAPIAAVIRNTNTRSGDYDNLKDCPRPGHADYTAQIKYGGYQDTAGGGHFSGRLTAPLCIAGGLCKQWLEREGIYICAHIAAIAGIHDRPFDPVDPEIGAIRADFPVLEETQGAEMREKIEEARSMGDSVGGILETIVTGLPAGIGEPWFDSVESELAHLMFAIPACKGIEFGAGFGFAAMHGSEANDPFTMRDGKIATATNKNGGINGGITNGMPIVFRTVLKPTPSIYKQQHTVDYIGRTDAELQIKGRHDPCIVPRAAVVQNSLTAFGLLDLLTVRYGTLAQKHGFPKV